VLAIWQEEFSLQGGDTMTIKELYEESKELGKEDYEISVCDHNGYRSTVNADNPEYDDKNKEVLL
jgi:hypothetical protein